MKIKRFQAAVLGQTYGPLPTEKLGKDAEKVQELYMAIYPFLKDYEDALMTFQKDAKDKKPEEVNDLVSAKAFEKVSNEEVDVPITLTDDDVRALSKYLRVVADVVILYNLRG